MAATTIQEKIVKRLRAAPRPMKALDIAREIGCTKKEVNQVIHKMREVERSNPGENPPLWRLYTGTASSANSGACGRDPVQRGASDVDLSGQLSGLTIGDGDTATWNGKQIATMEKTREGSLVINPIKREDIINREGSKPVQETCTPEGKEEEEKKVKKKEVDPLNIFSGHEVKEEFEKGANENDSSKDKEKTYSSEVLKSVAAVKNESSPSPSDSKAKKKPMLAANFSGVVQSSSSDLKEEILAILRREGKQLSTFEVSRKLGHDTRQKAMRLLFELEKEGKVKSVEENKISVWSIKEGD